MREIVGRGVAPPQGHLVVVRTGWQLERHAKESPSKERPQSDAQFGYGLGGFDVNANLVFERATGKLVNVFSGFWPEMEADQVSPVLLWTICHAKCDAVEATPLS